MKGKTVTFIVLVLFIGAAIGTALGELIGYILPAGVVEQFFLRSATIGFNPFTLDLGVFNFTLGFKIKLNIVGIIGIAFAAYILRWYRNERNY